MPIHETSAAILLREAGEALYGPQWHHALARALGVQRRQIYRWQTAEYSMPTGVVMDLLRLVRERGLELRALAQRLERAA